jgi:Domain of unknown function (DUF4276)
VRLVVLVEGQTEETFVRDVLREHLVSHGYSAVVAKLLGNSRRTGIDSWPRACADVLRTLKEDRRCLLTTLVDYYGMPSDGGRAWPGRAAAADKPGGEKAAFIGRAILEAVAEDLGDRFDKRRFLPFVAMHEFEALLFSDCESFALAVGRPQLAGKLQAIRDQFTSPEEINDSPKTAPSKRLRSLLPSYQKPVDGPFAAKSIGLDRIRAECPHFDRWVRQLEAWPAAFAAK